MTIQLFYIGYHLGWQIILKIGIKLGRLGSYDIPLPDRLDAIFLS